MPKVRILRQAADEAEAAAAWYEQEKQGLGAEFVEAIEAGIDVIEDGFLPLSPVPGPSRDRRQICSHPAARAHPRELAVRRR